MDYREILRLRSIGCSQRQMERDKLVSREKSKEIFEAADRLNIHWPLSPDITNQELELLLFPDKYKNVSRYAEPDYAYIHSELAKSGVNMTLLWNEYCQTCHANGKTPYQYTQFCEKYRRWARVTKATMRIQHKPGDATEVDWAGDTIPLYDSVTGEESAAYLFLAALPCSCMAYAEAREDMRTESWLLCHVHAFNYFGGVTRLLIPDNCKTATISNNRYEIIFNRSYQELAEHYGTAIVPARVRKPRDKSHAEGSVRFAETWIIAALRNQKFFSLRELNEAVREKLEELNNRPFKQRVGSRRSAFLEEEKPFLLPLPARDFEPAVWSVAKVGVDYLITDGLNKYSVPCNLIGEQVDIRTTSTMVEVLYHGGRVAAHKRFQTRQHDPIVIPEHMPPEHRAYLNYNAEGFRAWAAEVGPMTGKVVEYFLTSGKAPEQGYKSCASLTKLKKRYGAVRLERACERLLSFSSSPSIRNLSSILKNGQDKPQRKEKSDEPEPSYGITRGPAYFRRGGEQE